ncbi:uncharacterized protein LOC593369 [Strongylocentrotus purpuratus]|uniref:EGF-like domain-containing protein n=1 Tax=Strongylocentrotus purpuratus TaxID=7668 RepID=A0A7M7GJ28_STRPU|nr:uncharacterized protein LOC593369 [Strongylocentrotus purpuratus]
MASCLILAFALFIVGDSVADRISGDYHVDWDAEWQNHIQQYADYSYPFEQPGVIFPGLTVQDAISTVGKTWHATEMKEVLGIFCRDIAPSLVVPVGQQFISSICDPIFDSLNTNTRIDGFAICDAVYSTLGDPMSARRRRRMTPGKSLMGIGVVRNFNFEKVGHDINRRIFNLHSYDKESICTAFDEFVNSDFSTQRLIQATGEIFLEEAIAQGSQICQHWDAIYDVLRRTDEQPGEGVPDFFQTLMVDVSQLIAEFSGFDNRESLCDALVEATDPLQTHQGYLRDSRVWSLAVDIIHNMVHTLIINDQCTDFGNDVANVIVNLSPYIDFDIIQFYVQMVFDLQSIGEACSFVDDAFAFQGCAADTCANGGLCEYFQGIFSESFRCTCAAGYVGTDCGVEIHE